MACTAELATQDSHDRIKRRDMSNTITLLSEHREIEQSVCDAKVVAVRWDLVPWGLVIDIDVPLSEAENAPLHRAWIVFDGMNEINWNFNNSRLPDGIWLTSNALVKQQTNGGLKFTIATLLPKFSENEPLPDTGEDFGLSITAKNILVFRSDKSISPGKYGLTRQQRLSLADDTCLLDTVTRCL